MQHSISNPAPERPPPNEPTATVSRLRTVTENRLPRNCACGCGFQIPRDPEVRYVVDFGATRPFPAYLREHSPDYGTYHGKSGARADARSPPAFTPGSELLRPEPPKPPVAPRPAIEVAHEGRPIAPVQLGDQGNEAPGGFQTRSVIPSHEERLRVRVFHSDPRAHPR